LKTTKNVSENLEEIKEEIRKNISIKVVYSNMYNFLYLIEEYNISPLILRDLIDDLIKDFNFIRTYDFIIKKEEIDFSEYDYDNKKFNIPLKVIDADEYYE